jgi:predicted phage terminase large subunit-like protein
MQGLKVSADKALAELCRRSFYRFLQEFWSVLIPEVPVWNWHIKYLCDELQYLNAFVVARKPKPYDLVINVPPGSTKSTIASQAYNAWIWTVDPTQRIIGASYANALSLSHAIKTRDIVQSDKYRRLFPEVELKSDQTGKSDFRNTHGGQRFTTSTGGSITGMHAHQIIIDDPINPLQAASDTERQSANDFVTKTLSTRKIDKAVTPTILIMQRLHEQDPTGVMLSKKANKIKHICLPAEDEGNVLPREIAANYVDGLLDPVRLSLEILEESKTDLGGYGYAGQFKQKPAPDEGGILKKAWFDVVDWQPGFEALCWNVAADTAYTASDKNDPSGFIAYAEYQNTFYIRSIAVEHLEFPELCRSIASFANMNGYTRRSMIYVEPKASGKSLVQTIRRETSLNITEGANPTTDKIARVKGISPMCEAKRVKLIRGVWNEQFLDEVCTFPNAAHDELVDCLTMMLDGQRKKNIGIRRTN